MGAETKISWCDHTFQPWIGCQRVSPGCEHCYAETYDKRVGGVPKSQRDHYAALTSLDRALKPGESLLRWGPKAPRTRTSASYWKQPLKWDAAAKAAGVRKRVFCASLADVFEDRPELVEWRQELFDLIGSTQALDWLLLTKRPENIARLWPHSGMGNYWPPGPEHWPNVWLGATLEDKRYDRVVHLREVPAVVHFLSCEPLLEHVSPNLEGIDWVIIGGESGHGARGFDLTWAFDLVRQARVAGVAPFVKQLGAKAFIGHSAPESERGPWTTKDRASGDMAEWPADLRVREFPTPHPPKGET